MSASGMSAQTAHAPKCSLENMANAETTRTPEGGPYGARTWCFRDLQASHFDRVSERNGRGRTRADVVTDDRAPELRYQPGIPTPTPTGTWLFRA